MASSSYAPSVDSGALSPILSPTASPSDLSGNAFPPRSSSARPLVRRGSTASSVVSFSSVGTAMDWRLSKDFGGGGSGGATNSTAISALVESSNSRSSTTLRPRPGDIPPVTLTQIPKIKPSAFAPYLTIASEYARYQRSKDQGLEDHIRLSQTNQDGEGLLSPTPSLADLTVTDGRRSPSRTPSPRRFGRGRKGSLAVTPLSTVPQVYFDENFHLENPRVFDVVSERSEVIRSTAPARDDESEYSTAQSQRKALATNAILQEKLSWYMDTVEVHLIASISTASSSFFAALGDLRDLHSEAAASVDKIQGLRKELVRLDEEQAIKGLEIVRLRRRRDSVAKLARAVRQIERVASTARQAEDCLNDNSAEAASNALEEAERFIAGTGEEGLIDLSGVVVLDAVGADLSHLRYRIGKEFERRFVECLLSDLRRHVKAVSSTETLRRFSQSFQREQYQRFMLAQQYGHLQPPPRSSSLPPEYTQLSEGLRKLLMQHLNGLKRANYVNNAVQAYRDAVIREAKNMIRGSMPSEDDDADSISSGISRASRPSRSNDKSVALARALTPAEAEDLFVKIYTNVSETIRRLGTQQKLLLDVTMQMGVTGVGSFLSPRLEQNGFGSPNPNGPSPERPDSSMGDTLSMDISDLISSAVEISHSDIVKIVKLRTEQVARYPIDRFIRYFTLNRLFAQECEAMCVRVGSGLQNAVSSQIREFLTVYQEEMRNTLSETLVKDKWAAKEVDEQHQAAVDRIVKASTSDPEEWTSLGRLWELRGQERDQKVISSATENGDKKPEATPQVLAPTTNGNTPSAAASADVEPSKAPAEEPKKSPHALIESQKFILPESGLMLLQDLESYLRLVVMLPGTTSDLAAVIIDLIKLFNSRTFQLIHGAGATRSAGLKSITTRHLAIASQALSIIITLIPYLRECIRRHSPPSSAASTAVGFDSLKRSTQDYQSEIHGKLVSIMADRARAHLVAINNMDWDTPHPENAEKYYMDTLCRETGVLYKVLNKHLPVEQVRGIMKPVFDDYRAKLVQGFGGVKVKSEDGRKRALKDAEQFKERLGGLEGAGQVPELVLEAARKVVVGKEGEEGGGPNGSATA